MRKLSVDVTTFLDDLQHPLRAEIELLRRVILNAHESITENIKWNGPNYCFEGKDRITMRIHPPRQIQLIFHRGVKKQAQPERNLIEDHSGLLLWKEHDRAVATFKDLSSIKSAEHALIDIINKWVKAAPVIGMDRPAP